MNKEVKDLEIEFPVGTLLRYLDIECVVIRHWIAGPLGGAIPALLVEYKNNLHEIKEHMFVGPAINAVRKAATRV